MQRQKTIPEFKDTNKQRQKLTAMEESNRGDTTAMLLKNKKQEYKATESEYTKILSTQRETCKKKAHMNTSLISPSDKL